MYEIKLDGIIELFRQVGNDYPNCGSWTFNPARQDYDCSQWIEKTDQQSQSVAAKA